MLKYSAKISRIFLKILISISRRHPRYGCMEILRCMEYCGVWNIAVYGNIALYVYPIDYILKCLEHICSRRPLNREDTDKCTLTITCAL